MWNQTFQMTTIEIQCTDHTGVAKRTCGSDGQWGEPDYSNCIRSDLIDLNTKLQNMVNKTVSPEETYEIVVEFENITKADNLLSGDLQYSADILNDVADSVANTNASTPYDILQPFVNSCNNLLQETNNPAWLELKTLDLKGITQLAKSVPVFLTGYNKQSNASFERIVERKNIVVQTGRSVPRTIVFPNVSHPSLASVPTRVVLTNESVKENQMFGYSFVYYKNVSDLFHDYRLLKGQSVANSNDFVVNSAVVDVSLDPKPERLKAPLSIEFSHSKSGYNKPECVFWDFNARNTPNGAWSPVGADLVNTSTKSTTCHLYHTTNFAIIMSTSRTPDIHAKALSIISLIGCGVSIGFLIITIVVYSLLWRYITRDKRGHIKRDSAITLMNFCVALILSYAVFLAGINRTENKKICTGIAVILHYLFLVDFSVMLMFGIEMAMSVLFVMTTFSTGSKIKLMCIAAWGVPALIVGTTMALKLDGYGTSEYCWLAIESSYLIWAFIGPALLVILINIVILILVLRTILSTEKLRRMSSKDQTKTTFRNICIILPVFGTTWVFGALSINDDTIMFQYLFAIFNSLQGFFVFLFHCCLSKNIHEAVRSSRESKGTSYIYSDNNKGSTLEFSKDGGSTSDTFQTSEATDLSEIDLSKTSNRNKTKRKHVHPPYIYTKKSKEDAYDNRIQWASTSPEVSYSAKQRGKRYLY